MDGFSIAITCFGLLTVLVGLYSGRGKPAIWFVAVAIGLYLSGVLTLGETLSGLTNEGVVTLAALLVIAHLVQQSGLLERPIENLLTRANGQRGGFINVLAPVAVISGFLNNTPIVSMLLHPVREWAIRRNTAPSRYLLPLSFAAIVGGTLTLVGTSTNLVVFGLLGDLNAEHSLSLLSPAWVGVPLVCLFLVYYSLSHRWLPNRTPTDTSSHGVTQFQIPAAIGRPLIGKTVEAAKLRNLKHGYLYRVRRGPEELLEATGETHLKEGDILIFLGAPQLVKELSHIKGIDFPSGYSLSDAEPTHLVEAVVPLGSSLIGKTPKELGFRKRFGSVIVSIAHQTEQRYGKLGQYPLKAGDLLLLEALNNHTSSLPASELMVLNRYHNALPSNTRWRAYGLLAAFPIMVVGGSALGLPLLNIALVFIGLALLIGLAQTSQLSAGLDLELFSILIGALALARAIDKTGLADQVIQQVAAVPLTPMLAIAAIFAATWLVTELLTNNSAAALMLPFALPLGQYYGLNVNQIAVTVMIGASTSFITPFGYQTNLMVLSAGNYKPLDYVAYGLPLVAITGITTTTMVHNFL
ncbi:SLC13 family permease [Saccharospirillum salsuginis]|uniref:SLC13 family permease n=1 Tax=Saccharospirillum salsuginis TaxID=418750 RepID=A0A918NCJ1_9GAMM|nr:SLC13 family permease [Saccharospirillum salsuginis]GGX60158.1 SLC13 family permease [Saccharospirillum salsuginis]